jgi:hypothetical protein
LGFGRKGGELKGTISMKIVEDIRPVLYNKKRKNCFEMGTPDRNYHFSAETEDLMNQWIEVLTRSRDTAKGTPYSAGSAVVTVLP